MKFIILSLLIPLTAMSAVFHAPENFKNSDGNVIYVDFKTAEYNITYDAKTKTAQSVSRIVFESDASGMPAFDLKENPTHITLDGEVIDSKVISSPDQDTWFRILLKNISPGTHTMTITAPLREGVQFVNDGVSSAFWFTDLGDRGFLEAYLPANLEYDQVKMTLNLDFKNLSKQKFYTNGIVSKFDNNKFRIEFPETYTSSSLYFHTAPEKRYREELFSFRSIDGRDLPAVVYAASAATSLKNAREKIIQSLEGLEAKFGPFLHNSVTVFIAGSGGMEYCGATMTDTWALNHELTHSYFARGGLMPANGNSGWVDEAITSWYDEGGGTRTEMTQSSNMAGNSQYRRYTHSDAYSIGKNFMSYLNYKFQSQGGLNSFLSELVKTENFKPMTTEEFIFKMSSYYSEDLTPVFKKHAYSKKAIGENVRGNRRPVHMKMTIPEMRQFL